jgi:hypothetical protein
MKDWLVGRLVVGSTLPMMNTEYEFLTVDVDAAFKA